MAPHPLLLVLCIGKQLPDVGLGLADVLVEDLGAVDDLGLPGIQHLADLPRHQRFTAARGPEQQDALHVLAACRRRSGSEARHGNSSSASYEGHLFVR